MPNRSQLARVHIAKKDLKLSDSLYRDFLHLWFGKRSAKNLTPEEVEELLTHFKGLGWGQVRSAPAGPLLRGGRVCSRRAAFSGLGSNVLSSGPPLASQAQLHKIQTLWMTGPGVRTKTPTDLKHFLEHHFHISSLGEVKAFQVAPILGAIRKIAEPSPPERDKEKSIPRDQNPLPF